MNVMPSLDSPDNTVNFRVIWVFSISMKIEKGKAFLLLRDRVLTQRNDLICSVSPKADVNKGPFPDNNLPPDAKWH